MIKILVITLLLACIAPFPASGDEPRDIFSVTGYNLEGMEDSTAYENVLLMPLAPSKLLVVKLNREQFETRDNNMVTAGPIFLLNEHDYTEVTFGYSFDTRNINGKYFSAEFNREMAEYTLGAGLKHVAFPSFDYTIATLHGKIRAHKYAEVSGKYFLSDDSAGKITNSVWTEIEITASEHFLPVVGFTSGDRLYDAGYDAQGEGKFYSWIAGLAWKYNKNIRLKLMHENTTREGLYRDTKGVFLVDIKFPPK